MEEENFNWIEAFIQATEKKDIKNGNSFKVLNENNIDTNELTKHEKDKDAGVIELNYKDEQEKEVDKRSFAKGALAFVADMPEETMKALMMAFLNGTDVSANFIGVVFNAMTNQSPAMAEAFKNGDAAEFKNLVNGSIQEFSKYLSNEKEQVKVIGEGSELNSKAAEFVSMVTQDTPYSMPIYKKLKSMGIPSWMALPVAYGMGSGIAFSDDATLFLNSEQVQNLKEMSGALPNSSEEKIFNTVFRTFEGTSLGFLTGPVVKALSFAKKSIPKYMDNQMAVSVGSAASVTAAVDKANSEEIKTFDPEVVKKLTDVMEGYRIQDVIDGLAIGLPDSELLGFLEGEFEPSALDIVKKELGIEEPTTDAEIDAAYGVGASENAMVETLKPKTNQDMQNMITKAEKADDQVLFYDENTMTESGPEEPLNEYIKIIDPYALKDAGVVFFDPETNEQMTYQKINESDDSWIILNKDKQTSYKE
tara:strand:- start:818 stop:2248 length:1431 start_codon:yes stop_codon:yes gene_type:complete